MLNPIGVEQRITNVEIVTLIHLRRHNVERFTISIDEELAREFDSWIAAKGYLNRSEAVRDLVRERLGAAFLEAGKAKWCIATLTYVYDRTEPAIATRVVQWQHAHHDLVVTTHSAPLDHRDCLETVVARGKATNLEACARQLIATKGVRHGNLHLVPLRSTQAHTHDGIASDHHSHHHLQPLT